jgi:hypothetical protein
LREWAHEANVAESAAARGWSELDLHGTAGEGKEGQEPIAGEETVVGIR